MKRILILMGRYLPGHKDGGPLRTVVNITNLLGEEYDFRIITQDRDHGDIVPYDGVDIGSWTKVGKANVMYVRPGGFKFSLIRNEAKKSDVVYSCGFYNEYGYKSLILNKLGLLYKRPMVVAPMGTFSPGALSSKRFKKHTFISGCKFLGLFNNVTWSVTSNLEAADLRKTIGNKAPFIIAEDIPRAIVPGSIPKINNKATNVVFLSRISPIKNLLGAIEILKLTKSDINFSICGPISDEGYWKKCQEALKKLPPNVKFSYCGDINTDDVQSCLSKYDLFLFPTLGENYGHVIFEALSVGCIPLIGDQTPWSIIREENAGYIDNPQNSAAFAKFIDAYVELSEVEKNTKSAKAVEIAKMKVEEAKRKTGYRTVFNL